MLSVHQKVTSMYVLSILSLLIVLRLLSIRQERWVFSVRISWEQVSASTVISDLVLVRSFVVRRQLSLTLSKVSVVCLDQDLLSQQLRDFGASQPVLTTLRHLLVYLTSFVKVLQSSQQLVLRSQRVLRYSLSVVRLIT